MKRKKRKFQKDIIEDIENKISGQNQRIRNKNETVYG